MPETSAFIGNVSFPNFLLFIFVIIFTFILGSLVNILIIKLLKEKIRPVIYKTVSKIAMYSIYAVGLYLAVNKIINFNFPATLAALGIFGALFLLPAVPILQNIVAGFVIAFERPFKEEDIIDVNGTLCKVKDIMLRKTRLRALDGKIVIVPNISFITGNIINYSKGEFIKIMLTVEIDQEADRSKAISIIENICNENPNILPNVPQKKLDRITKFLEIPKNFFVIPKNIKVLTPRVFIKNVNKEKISLDVWFWIWNIELKEKIASSFYEKLIDEFAKEKIKFGPK